MNMSVSRKDFFGSNLTPEQVQRIKIIVANDNEAKFSEFVSWCSEFNAATLQAFLQIDEKQAAEHRIISGQFLEYLERGEFEKPDVADPEFLAGGLFRRAFLPVILFARNRLICDSAGDFSCLRGSAMNDLENALFHRLMLFGSRLIHKEFCIFRAREFSDLHYIVSAHVRPSSAAQQDFTVWLNHRGGWRYIFSKYPVFARLIGLTIDFWISYISDFKARFNQDVQYLLEFPGAPKNINSICHIDMDCSDPHVRGSTVAICELENDYRVVYKPRSLGMEVAVSQISKDIEDITGLSGF